MIIPSFTISVTTQRVFFSSQNAIAGRLGEVIQQCGRHSNLEFLSIDSKRFSAAENDQQRHPAESRYRMMLQKLHPAAVLTEELQNCDNSVDLSSLGSGRYMTS